MLHRVRLEKKAIDDGADIFCDNVLYALMTLSVIKPNIMS